MLQIKRREEGQALGAEAQAAAASFRWGDQFWVDIYNKAAQQLTSVTNEKKKVTSSKKSKKSKRVETESESSDGEFDGEIVI